MPCCIWRGASDSRCAAASRTSRPSLSICGPTRRRSRPDARSGGPESHHAREGRTCPFCGGRRLQVGVEAYGDAPQQQPSHPGYGDSPIPDHDQAIGDTRLQPRERLVEIGGEVDTEVGFDRTHVDRALAHELSDDRRTHPVIRTQREAAPERQLTGSERRFPLLQLAEILAEAVIDVTDRAHTEADEVSSAMCRVAHEVAL